METKERGQVNPIVYPEGVSNDKARRQYRHTFLTQNAEKLFLEINNKKFDQIFYTEDLDKWHKIMMAHFKELYGETGVKKTGFSEGRQLIITDTEDNTVTVSFYSHGYVQIKGTIEKEFELMKKAVAQGQQGDEESEAPANGPSTTQRATSHPTALTTEDYLSFREKLTQMEVELVELRHKISTAPAEENRETSQPNQMENTDHKKLQQEIATLRQEMKTLKEDRDHCIAQVTILREEIQQWKEETSREKIAPPKANKEPTAQTPPPPSTTEAAKEPKARTPPPRAAEKTSQQEPPPRPVQNSQQAEVVILIDSNGKFIDEKRLFPKHKAVKMRCQNTKKALELLNEETIGKPSHIIIHTGTNDIQSQQEKVDKSINAVIDKASATFPQARVVISSLLPRKDIHLDTINRINHSVSRHAANKANISVATHSMLHIGNLYDNVHLRKDAVAAFTKSLKDAALNRQCLQPRPDVQHKPRHPPHGPKGRLPAWRGHQDSHHMQGKPPATPPYSLTQNRRAPLLPTPPHHSYTQREPARQQPAYQSYAHAVRGPPASTPATTSNELTAILQKLDLLCQRVF